jgi:hypothetical protein
MYTFLTIVFQLEMKMDGLHALLDYPTLSGTDCRMLRHTSSTDLYWLD